MELEAIEESEGQPPPRSSEPEVPVQEPAVEDEPEDAGDDDAALAPQDDTDFLCCVCCDTEADDDNPIIMCDGGCGKGEWGRGLGQGGARCRRWSARWQ